MFGQTGYWRLRQMSDTEDPSNAATPNTSKRGTNKRPYDEESSPEQVTPPQPREQTPEVPQPKRVSSSAPPMYVQQMQYPHQVPEEVVYQQQLMRNAVMQHAAPKHDQMNIPQQPLVQQPLPTTAPTATIPSLLDEQLTSKEFAWHFCTFLSRSKIVTTFPLPVASNGNNLSYQVPAAQPQPTTT